MLAKSDAYTIAAVLAAALGAPWWAWAALAAIAFWHAAPRSKRPRG